MQHPTRAPLLAPHCQDEDERTPRQIERAVKARLRPGPGGWRLCSANRQAPSVTRAAHRCPCLMMMQRPKVLGAVAQLADRCELRQRGGELRLRRGRSLPSTSCSASPPRRRAWPPAPWPRRDPCARIAVSASTVTTMRLHLQKAALRRRPAAPRPAAGRLDAHRARA